MFDLALSPYGDLIFAANRDLLGCSGTDRLEQCIRIRLKLPRGGWVYDLDKRLGSRIHRVLQHAPDRAQVEIPIYVREALDDMDEITVGEVQVEISDGGRSWNLIVGYSVSTLPEGAGEPSEPDVEEFIISLPL